MSSIHFPALKKTLFQLMGPSIILVALALSGGEFLLWPNLVANYGMSILWPIPIILFLQFIVNMEIERYTLVTGKSVEEHLAGRLRWLAIFFAFTVVITLVWPAWVATAGNLLAVVGGQDGAAARNTGLLLAILLLCLSFFVFHHPRSYAILERVSQIGLLVALCIITGIVAYRFDLTVFIEGIKGLFSWGHIPDGLPRFDFLAALAYGGVAGMLNLAQSEWILDKGYGVAGLPEHQRAEVDHTSHRSRFHFLRWFRVVNQEHFLVFFCANIASIFLLAFLGRLLLPIGSAQGFEVLVAEVKALNVTFPGLGALFGISGAVMFAMANLTILDVIGRLTFRLLTPLRRVEQPIRILRIISRAKREDISMAAAVIGIIILLFSFVIPSFKQPFVLLITTACLSAGAMWIYPPFLLRLNLELPVYARPTPIRIILLMCATLFYGFVTLWALAPHMEVWMVVLIGIVVTAYHIKYIATRNPTLNPETVD